MYSTCVRWAYFRSYYGLVQNIHCRKIEVFKDSENDKLDVWKMWKHQHIMFSGVLLLKYVFIRYSYWQDYIGEHHIVILFFIYSFIFSRNSFQKHIISISKYQTVDTETFPATSFKSIARPQCIGPEHFVFQISCMYSKAMWLPQMKLSQVFNLPFFSGYNEVLVLIASFEDLILWVNP